MPGTGVQPYTPTTLTLKEQQTLTRLLPLFQATHSYPVAVQKPITQPILQEIDGTRWELTPLDNNDQTPHPVPHAVYERITALEAQGIRFTHFVWGEELDTPPASRPNFVPYIETERTRPAAPAEKEKRKAARAATRARLAAALRDPLLLGYLPFDAQHGCYVLLGRWEH
jgi:hypothetical protein